MNGTTVVLTGATSGIGEAAARRFAATCDRLILHGPESRGDVASLLGTVAADGRAELHHLEADLDDLDNVSRPATPIGDLTPAVDILVNDAGRPGPARRTLSRNGHEATLQTNYLAAVLLTHRLSHLLPPRHGRVVHVASATHLSVTLDLDDIGLEHGYSPVRGCVRCGESACQASWGRRDFADTA